MSGHITYLRLSTIRIVTPMATMIKMALRTFRGNRYLPELAIPSNLIY
uniref:Uncharacterized protein n=1 Tax=uncultured bacterium EIL107F05 TaxID=1768198 RepID=A0A0U2W5Y1_9BACT|nr:hypothetical protein [uncultured bacterium EIL107F05]